MNKWINMLGSLHDAQITDIISGESKNNYNNYLRIIIDAEGAYDSDVKEILLYNYRASWKGGRIKDFSFYINSWWLGHNFSGNVLTLHLQSLNGNRLEEYTITIEFDQMEVVR